MADTLVPTTDMPEQTAPPQAGTTAVPQNDLPEQPGMEVQQPEEPQSLGESVKAGLEAAGRGVLGPLAPGLERETLHITKAEQLAREKAHPVASAIGETAGLIGSAFTGVGEGALMERAGLKAAELAGLAKPATYVAKVGSSALKASIEMGILQGSDEISKVVMNDPDTSSEAALANLGMATALGGATGAFITGAISPLWKATAGKQLEGALTALTGRLGGAEGEAAKVSVGDLESKIGLNFDPEIRGVIDQNPIAQRTASILNQQDTTMAGRKFQDKMKETIDALGDKVAETLGIKPEVLESLKKPNEYETGKSVADALHNSFKPEAEAISSGYDKFRDAASKTLILRSEMQSAADQIASKAIEEGWNKSANKANNNLLKDVMKMLPKQETVQDLDKFISNLRKDNPFTSETYNAAKTISGVLRDIQENVISSRLSPEQLVDYQRLRFSYRNLMDRMDRVDQHLHVGRWDGPQSFLQALKETGESNGEKVLRNLKGENKANVLDVLKEHPEAAQIVKNYHINDLLSDAAQDASHKNLGLKVNTSRLMKNFRNMSPQLQEFLANKGQINSLEAIDTAMNRLKDPNYNWSNTARTLDKHMSSIASPTSLAMELVSEFATHIPLLGFLMRQGLAETGGAARLSLLKYLGSNQTIDAAGFKSMAALVNNSMKFSNMTVKAVDNVFVPGARVVASQNMPGSDDRQRLDKMVDKFQDNQMLAMELTHSQIGHYMPDHQTAMSGAVVRNMQYLASLKPHTQAAGPIQHEMPTDPTQEARYNRALDIANNPLVVLQHAKDGTLKLTDIQDLNAMYPAVLKKINHMVVNQINSNVAEQKTIPYKTRMGLSLMLGQPLDPSMEPQNILAAQPISKPSPQQPTMQGAKRGTATLGKSTHQYMTPNQASEADKSKRD